MPYHHPLSQPPGQVKIWRHSIGGSNVTKNRGNLQQTPSESERVNVKDYVKFDNYLYNNGV